MKKRLFKCSAYVEWSEKENGYNYNLISYNTKICTVVIMVDCDGCEDITVKLYRYRSNTTQSHIHKFAKWLQQNIVGSSAGHIVELLQRRLVRRRANYGVYDGQFNVFDLNWGQLKQRGFEYNKSY